MVLEKLVPINYALKNPWVMFLNGVVVSLACLFISFFVFGASIGLLSSLLITVAMMPFMVNLIRFQEAKDEDVIEKTKEPVFRRHKDILMVYAAFSLGIIISFSIVYTVLPDDLSSRLFSDQINEINRIRGSATFADTFQAILFNNIGVMFLSFLFSFLFGAGAIFILTWNASVLAAAIGDIAKAMGGMRALPIAVLPFLPHGTLEFLAFFIGAISGGLVSAAVTRRFSKHFWGIIGDSFKLLIISVLVLVAAAFIETVAIAM